MVYSTVAALNLSTLTQNNHGRITKKVDVPNNTTTIITTIEPFAFSKYICCRYDKKSLENIKFTSARPARLLESLSSRTFSRNN